MEPGKEQIILTSERLLFRQHTMADMDAFCAMEMDPEVRKYVGGKPRTRQEAEQRFMNNLQSVTDSLSMWATVLRSGGKYIGRCGIYPHFDTEGNSIKYEAALGLYIARNYWGKGFATEAGRSFIQFGFNELNIRRIVTAIQVGNDASEHIIRKLGFALTRTEEGPIRSFYHFELNSPQQ